MDNTNPRIVILSRERAYTGVTWSIFPDAILCVNEDEKDNYIAAGHKNEIWTHDCNRSPTVRNFILDRIQELDGPGGEVVIMDDDIRSVGRFVINNNGKARCERMKGSEYISRLEKGFETARAKGYHLFGVAPTTNSMNYNPKRAIKQNVFINGPLMCIRVTDLRFDAELPVKCDYEFTAQHINAGLGVFRMDDLWQDNDFDTLPGGRACYKSEDDAASSFKTLMRRWPQYFRANKRRPNEVILSVQKRGCK